MPLVMKRSAFLVAMDRPVVSRTVRCRCFSSSFFPSVPHTRPMHVSRMAMLRYLSIRSKDDQGFFVDDEIFESEKPPSHNNINTGSSSRALRVSSSHIDNKLEMQRIGPIPSNQKPFAEQIHRPELQATIFVPGTVGSLPNLLAIVREAERRYGPITEYRCPTVVSSISATFRLVSPVHLYIGICFPDLRIHQLVILLKQSTYLCFQPFHFRSHLGSRRFG